MNSKKILLGHTIEVSELRELDVEQLEPILEEHVRDRNTHEIVLNEITEIKSYMRGEKDDNARTRRYLVARDETGKVWGCMAYSTPDPDMVTHFQLGDEPTAELLNALVSSEIFRGGGVGKRLFDSICAAAKADGNK